jgi:hypothetical protein
MLGHGEGTTDAGRRAVVGSAGWLLLAGAVLAGGCRRGATGESEFMTVIGTVRVREQILSGPIQVPGRQVDLAFPSDILVLGDSVWIIDNGNDRMVVLDRGLRVLEVIGREGEGPGEFQAPTAVRASPGGVTTVDMGNARFTEFDRTGRYVRSWPAPSGLLQFGMSASGVAYVQSSSRVHHYVRIDGDTRTELGIWPHPVAPGERVPLLPEMQSVEVTAGDTVHVYDEEDAVLYKYGPEGELLMAKKLPAAVRDSIIRYRDGVIAGFRESGRRVLGVSTSLDFGVTSTGDLLLLVRAGDVVGLLIDPGTYTARQLVSPRFADGSVQFRVTEAALADSTLYVLSDHDVRMLRIEEAR